ncbi:MAG TPA: hypothetical protein VF796_26080 [Humisphaera sp.]
MLRCFAAAAIAVFSLTTAGCNVTPVTGVLAYQDDMGHRRVSDAFIAGLTLGTTTADGVRWNLGKPTWEFDSGRILVYSWFVGDWRVYAIAVEAGAGGGAVPIGSSSGSATNHLVMEFGTDGVLRSQQTLKGVRINPDATSMHDLTAAPDTTRPSQ